MSTISPFKHRAAIERGDKFKAELLAARREIAALRKQLPEEYSRGSAEMLALVYAALDNQIVLIDWITTRMRAAGKNRPLPTMPEAIEDQIIREQLIAIARRRGKSFDPLTDLKSNWSDAL